MIQPIMKDVIFLSQKAEPATPEDKQVAMDLLDTLKAHEGECVGMVYPTRILCGMPPGEGS